MRAGALDRGGYFAAPTQNNAPARLLRGGAGLIAANHPTEVGMNVVLKPNPSSAEF
jgi:hypothetical protein